MKPTYWSNSQIQEFAQKLKVEHNLVATDPKIRAKKLFTILAGKVLHDEDSAGSYIKVVNPSFWYVNPKTFWSMHCGHNPLYALSCGLFILHSQLGKEPGQNPFVALNDATEDEIRICWEARVFAAALIIDLDKVSSMKAAKHNEAEQAHAFDLSMRYYDAFLSTLQQT